ncbi:uncharacterized protein FFM5_04388 [Fusarium fujikuroi]|nr:uncharacterized protein FFM5_04388 [Fusarium fujikuroi]
MSTPITGHVIGRARTLTTINDL